MKKFAIAAAALLFLSPAVMAGAYVGASVGQADTGISGGGLGTDGDDTGWKLMGGYTFMKFVGVEASYRDLGGLSETVGTTSFTTDASSMEVFGVGFLPLGEKFDVFAKLGYARIEMDATISDPTIFPVPLSVSVSDNELAYGAGMNWAVAPKIAVRLEYEAFDTADTVNMFSVGGLFKF